MSRSPVKTDGFATCVINGRFLCVPMTGVQRVAFEITKALADLVRQGHPAVAGLRFVIAVPAKYRARAEHFGLPVESRSSLSGNLWEQVALPRAARSAILLNLCNMGPIAKRCSITMLHDAQIFQSPQSYPRAFRMWYGFAQRVIARRHAMILTVSDFSAGELRRVGLLKAGAVVVHNGADHMRAIAADDGLVDTPKLDRGRYVLAPSSTLAHKNVKVLMAGFGDRRLRAMRLVLFGATDRARYAEAGIAVPENVVFAGRVDDRQLRGLYEGALCFAFPSRTEGFGLPPLEAMMSSCPVISSDRGAIPEVCGDAVLYANPDSADDWVEHILRLSGDRALRDRLISSGRRRAETFTWIKSAEKIALAARNLASSLGGAAANDSAIEIVHGNKQ